MRALIFTAFTLTLLIAGAFIWLGPAQHAHVDGPHATLAIAPPPADVTAPPRTITTTSPAVPKQPAAQPQPAAPETTTTVVAQPIETTPRDESGEQAEQPNVVAPTSEPRRTTEVAQPVATSQDQTPATTAGISATEDIFALPNDPGDGALGLGVGNLGPLEQANTN